MIQTTHGRRLWVLTTFLGLAFAVLAGQLVVLQYFSHEKYRLLAAQNTQRTYLSQPRRGDILDRNGHPLATCLPVKKVFANPHLIDPHHEEVARVLAPLLQYQPAALAALLKPVVRTNEHGAVSTNQYVNLRRKVSLEQWEKIAQALVGLNFHPAGAKLTAADKRFYQAFRRFAVYALEDQQRVYPSKSLACHVVGFAQEKEDEFNRITIADIEGKDGVEKCFDQQLRGFTGWRVTETDVRQREIVVYREEEVAARPGLNVVLTIDLVLQKIVEDELAVAMKDNDPISVSSVIVRPRTGEILAMATLPNFDLNNPGKAPLPAMRNRIIADRMEPGSTFKIVAVASALDRRVVGLQETIDCEEGRWMFHGRWLHDHEAHGVMTVEEILIKSSNIGTAKIGLRLGERRLYDSIHTFGFGARTGITLEGEDRGKVHAVEKWDKLMISRIPMGQAVAVTHLQMVMAMSAIANRGRLMRPMLIDRLERSNREVFAQYHPQVVRQVVDAQTAAQVVGALKRVVSSEGTAVKAGLEHYTVAGKTGTAEKPGLGGYLPDKYIASFMGFFPADAPELCISVVMDEPKRGYYGGQKAAPVFKRIAEQAAQHLKVRPDRIEPLSEPMTAVKSNAVNTVSLRRP